MIIGPPPKFHGTRDILSGEVVRTLGVKRSEVQVLVFAGRGPFR